MQESTKPAQESAAITPEKQEETTCCIVGGGPAGAVLALLLARKGVEVTLLEEHGDFARDFRGDTVHPSTMEILAQIGLAERVLQLKHTEARAMEFETPQGIAGAIEFKRLKTHYPYIALIPQVHFLECLTEAAKVYPTFHLVMGARAEKLIEEDGYVHGVHYRARDGWHELRAVLTVGADGRFSRIRKLAGFEPVVSSPPMDVLWFRLPHLEGDPIASGGKLDLGQGHFLVRLDRGNEWQIGYVIPKGGYQTIKAAGLEHLRAEIGALQPTFAERMQTLTEWKQIAVLSVESSMLKRWYRPGLLLIGDAAHVMTPVGGVGINYAIQDAVATANLLTEHLKQGKAPTSALASVQRRREWPTKLIQSFQRLMQKQIMQQVFTTSEQPKLPLPLWLILHTPLLRTIPARIVAFGPRREHVQNP
ncbi:MAG TPA: FAD-dependent oxidoreductase [Ktedonobacteraceae bacterium]|nr:FAD-dependent oxidoreductase [Ktedonobacteraceae bacterium]